MRAQERSRTGPRRPSHREPPPVPADAAATGRPGPRRAGGYRAAADAPETLRAYRADLACFRAWCAGEGVVSGRAAYAEARTRPQGRVAC